MFYSNMGNYFSCGKNKFIPQLSIEKFEEILKSSPCYKEINYIWECIKNIVYDESLEFKTINLNEKKGKNSYYLGEIKLENIIEIDTFLKDHNIELQNTRLMMINPNKFCYLVASIDERIEDLENDNKILGYYGEFGNFLRRVNENLENAKKYCLNDSQLKVIDQYIESFKTGCMKKYYESQNFWNKDKKPIIEANLGWIGNSLDPRGFRCSFEVK